MRYKHKGVTLAATSIAIVAWMFLGYISFIVMASPFSVLAAVRTARQAEQYAEFVANSLKLVDYSELGTAAHARRSLTGEISGAAGWESRVAIGAEQQIGSNPDNLQRIATIDIFQTGDTLSRYTLQVPLSSAGSNSSSDFSAPDYAHPQKKSLVLIRGGDGYTDCSPSNPLSSYTAPSNGWVSVIFQCSGGCYNISVNGIPLPQSMKSGYRGMGESFEYSEPDGSYTERAFFPVSKGDVIKPIIQAGNIGQLRGKRSMAAGTELSLAYIYELVFYPCL